MSYKPKGEILPTHVRAKLSLVLASENAEDFARRIGVSRTALLRAAAGAPLWPCTRIAVESYLAQQ